MTFVGQNQNPATRLHRDQPENSPQPLARGPLLFHFCSFFPFLKDPRIDMKGCLISWFWARFCGWTPPGGSRGGLAPEQHDGPDDSASDTFLAVWCLWFQLNKRHHEQLNLGGSGQLLLLGLRRIAVVPACQTSWSSGSSPASLDVPVVHAVVPCPVRIVACL